MTVLALESQGVHWNNTDSDCLKRTNFTLRTKTVISRIFYNVCINLKAKWLAQRSEYTGAGARVRRVLCLPAHSDVHACFSSFSLCEYIKSYMCNVPVATVWTNMHSANIDAHTRSSHVCTYYDNTTALPSLITPHSSLWISALPSRPAISLFARSCSSDFSLLQSQYFVT